MHLPRLTILTLALGLACGGGSDSTAPPGGGGTSNPPPGKVTVTIQDFTFAPATLSIKAGTTVRWTNAGPSAHTTTSDDATWTSSTLVPPSGGGGDYGDNPTAGGSFEFTFTNPGTFGYHCSLHPPSSYPNFTGTITVTQ
jgi:plastocyanin